MSIQTELPLSHTLTVNKAKAQKVITMLAGQDDLLQALGLQGYPGFDRSRSGRRSDRAIPVWREPELIDGNETEIPLTPSHDDRGVRDG